NFALDQLLLIPAHAPPHKQSRSISDAYHRYAMAVLATLDDPRVKVSAIEIEAPDKPYTFETIERLRGVYGSQAVLFFVMGADSFEELNLWREPERILANANVIVITRPGYDLSSSHLPPELAANIIDLRRKPGGPDGGELGRHEMNASHIFLTDYVRSDISATEIRRRVRDGETVEGMVPPRVADYIEKYGLYRRETDGA
ncbi:MAG TPA: nicotinate (nicotinamide) nucleotide adenylyltransferase, partial [Blastocatellia bacterium]|nr:nicotinate (nicotinamide) nucleotide adenylyltransferase [Blastocatellia bacterium]